MHYLSVEPHNEQNMINTADDVRNEEITVRYSIGNKSQLEQTLVSNSVHPFYNTIPKHITTFDEKYVLHCLELIHNCALREASSKMNVLPYGLNSNFTDIKFGDSYVTASQSMMNILKSPLLQNYGSIDFGVNFGKTSLLDVSEPVCSNFASPPQESSVMLSRTPLKEVAIVDHKRVVSISSTNSTFSDSPSASGSSTSFQGMLQCTWKNGLPHHVFTVDDKSEVYIANLLKLDTSVDKGLDYVYNFHSRKRGNKEFDSLESVGKMRVSTSITFGSNNSKTRETRFILSLVSNDDPTVEMQTSNHTVTKNKRLTKKVVDVFRSSHSYKQRQSSKFGGSSAIFEDTHWEQSDDVINGHDRVADKNYAPNLELAAIVVKDVHEEVHIGGWGLKFLKKSRNVAFKDTFEYSTSMNVLIPAGLHGGPKTRIGVPSSLIERWMSRGQCDWWLGYWLPINASQ